MGSKRIRKKQLKQDKFVRTTFEFTDWVRENQRTTTYMALAALVVVLVVYFYTGYQRKKEENAYTSLYQSMQSYRSGNYLLAATDIEKLLTDQSGTSVEDQALYYLANSYDKMGDYDKAEEILNRFRDEFGKKSKVSFDALLTLACVQEEKGEADSAASTYISAAAQSRFPYQEKQSRMNAARLFTNMGKYDQAVKQYDTILEGPLSDKISFAEMEEVRMLRAEVSAMQHSGDNQ